MKKIAFLFFTLLLTVAFAQEGEFEDDFGAYEDFDHEMVGEFEKELDQEVYDPFQGYNRVMTGFNDKFYVYLLNPVTKGYKTVAPKQLRDRFSDFFHNLMFPIRFANNILQGKFEGATIEIGRFLFNTTFGVGGLFDAASAQGLKVYDEDFGQTLGHYGVGSGPHIVMPFLGPTNARDLPSKFVDALVSPVSRSNQFDYAIPSNTEQMFYIQGARVVNAYSYKVDDYNLSKQYGDQYIFMRDMYENKRDRMIKE